ncbi:MAG: ABC transporter ATP-binding protein [Vallitaleaceae bacterium]|nr:ABC transporter ATP-binding protein [Vallitaleaceae bacterium]
MQPVLELINVSKSIRGKEIVKGINLTLGQAEVFGFLGPNGAGKTTTIRMIVGLIKATHGKIKICGHDISKDFVKAMSNIGCIIESPDIYKYLTGTENLLQFAAMDKRVTKARIQEVIELVGLENRIGDKISTYSLGMRQRIGIAQALLCRPKLLILDEPTNGLDPAGITEFRNLIRSLAAEEGMTVFVSSHLLGEVQQMCDTVSIISHGTVVKTAVLKDLLLSETVVWQLSDPQKALRLLKDKWHMDAVISNGNTVMATFEGPYHEEINKVFINEGIGLKYTYSKQNTLEELFLNLTGDDKIV